MQRDTGITPAAAAAWLMVTRNTLTHEISASSRRGRWRRQGRRMMAGIRQTGSHPAASSTARRRCTSASTARAYAGFAGDTLASALLANGVKLVGRSFKYHRPRGILTAGSEEPNALVELRTGARREPNTKATTVELYDGLEAASQNRWPSLRLRRRCRSTSCSRRSSSPASTTRPSCGRRRSGRSDLRAGDPPRRRPRPRRRRRRSRPLREGLGALRRAGRRLRPGRPGGRLPPAAAARASSCARRISRSAAGCCRRAARSTACRPPTGLSRTLAELAACPMSAS